MISPQNILDFQDKILTWYEENKRILPWRDSFNPYQVFVSETMLQQTQAERVIPKFEQFLDEVPDFEALSVLPKSDLLRLWSGLWFNSRALRLQQSAQKLMHEFDGEMPQDRSILQTFPGVWPYMSASVLAFAFNLEEPVIDTNIRRVLIHELQLDHQLKPKQLEEVARVCIPAGKSNDRHNALMDYGALVATAKVTGIKPLSKQSKFEWSKRQVRWNIMKRLVAHGETDLVTLKKRFAHKEFDHIVETLLHDGLVAKQGMVLRID